MSTNNIDIPVSDKPVEYDGIEVIQPINFNEIEKAVANAIYNERILDQPQDLIRGKIDLAKQQKYTKKRTSSTTKKRTPCNNKKENHSHKPNPKIIGGALISLALIALLSRTPLAEDLKTNKEISDMTKNIKTSFVNSNLAEKKSDIFNNISLTEKASTIIKKLNIDENDHIQLYILSLAISDSDYNAILNELGYGNFRYYITKELGYKDTIDKPAGQIYSEVMANKLRDLIKNNPDYLRSLYNKWGIYVTEDGKAMFLDDSTLSRGSH